MEKREVEHDERREHTRRRFVVDVHLHSEHNFWTGFTENLSQGGLFVASSADVAVGDRIRIAIKPPGMMHPVSLDAEVCWLRRTRRANRDAPPGFGVRFIEVPLEVATAIEEFIEDRSPLFYDTTTLL